MLRVCAVLKRKTGGWEDLIEYINKTSEPGSKYIAPDEKRTALLEYRRDQGFANPVIAFSYDIMLIAKISYF